MLRRNVLIFHSGALGDFVLTWPVAMALARIHPQSRIFYVTAGEKGRLAGRVLGVESKDAEDGWQHLFGDPAKLPDPTRRTLEGTHLILNFVAAEPDPWTHNARDASRGAEIITLAPRPPSEQGGHVSQFLLSQLAAHKTPHSAVAQMISSVNEKGAGTAWQGGNTLLLHPGSGGRDKCWPVPHWIDLATSLRQAGHDVKFLLGEVERDRLSPAALGSLADTAPTRWPATYSDLLAELATARAFVGNDSGPGHLAGIIGVPTLSLFGPTNPAVWKPLGPRVAILQAPALDALTPADVATAVLKFPATAGSRTNYHDPE